IGKNSRPLFDDDLARFHVEAHAFSRLEHPHIVRIYEVSQHDGRPYLVLEFVEGGTLKDRLEASPVRPRQAAAILETIARAVQFAHDQGVVHRDLKPGNILLTKDGQPKISDFGLARLLDSDADLTQSGQQMGTLKYMPPEQAAGRSNE